ncbi:MAG: hypothetical protein JWN71_4012 [Xanthobacteraceae bacterium]|nr:hypothetical protein [Xanthobacteraceae bacterium]
MTPDDLRLLHYLPLSTTSFTVLVAGFIVLFALIQLGILRNAYMRLGLSSRAAPLLLASLIGSSIDIPVAQLPGEQLVSGREVTYPSATARYSKSLRCYFFISAASRRMIRHSSNST